MVDYWERRSLARQRAYDMSAEKTVRTVRRAYERAEDQITADIERILRSFRENYNLDRETALTILREPYTKGYLTELKARLSKMENSPEKRALMARLNAAAYRARITRLEAAQMSARVDMALVADVEVKAVREGMLIGAGAAYNRTMYDLQKGTGVIFPSNGLSVSRANEILRQNWTGMNYSKRVWRNTEHVAELMSQAMEEMAMTGQVSVRSQFGIWRQLKGKLRDTIDQGERATQRLIMTEWSHINNQAEKTAMEDCGMEKYRFSAVLDKRTSGICRDLDGQIFPLQDAKTGKNYPPMHPWCRSLAVAVIDKKFTENMTRRATDPKTGEVQEIPYDMSYREWEAWQKAGGPNIEKWRKLQLTEEQKKDIMGMDWSRSGFRNEEKAKDHVKHLEEFDGIRFDEYVDKARKLLSAPITENTPAILRRDGTLVRYNFKTNEYVTGSEDGYIRTFFKPDENIEYWRREYDHD